MPPDDPTQQHYVKQFQDQVRSRQLKASVTPLGQVATPAADVDHDLVLKADTCWGLGCQRFPLGPARLDAFFEQRGTRSARALHSTV
eukprot:8663371-Alexandrium_andersonii.AAC.1